MLYFDDLINGNSVIIFFLCSTFASVKHIYYVVSIFNTTNNGDKYIQASIKMHIIKVLHSKNKKYILSPLIQYIFGADPSILQAD